MKSISICLKTKVNNENEIEKTFISFKGKNQLPLIMIIREYINVKENDVFYADCLFSTNFKIGRFIF